MSFVTELNKKCQEYTNMVGCIKNLSHFQFLPSGIPWLTD